MLYIYLLQQNQNDICDQKLRSIQEAMRSDKPYISKFKSICTYLPNMSVIAKSATPGDIQVT